MPTLSTFLWQCELQATKSNMLLELFCQMISEPCFNELRTKEQLGYIVVSGPRRGNGAQVNNYHHI